MMPTPSNSEKKMIASTSPSASAATGLVGTISSRRSVIEGASVETGAGSTPSKSTPMPGRISVPKVRPMTLAKIVVTK